MFFGCDELGNMPFKILLFVSSDTCQISGASSANFTCSASTKSSLSNYLYVFILGQLLLGVGGTPLYTLGTAFIDDSVPKHTSSLYIGKF